LAGSEKEFRQRAGKNAGVFNMGQTDLIGRQRQILEFIAEDKYLTANFFFTGGTALSAFYFHHRFSEDLDFFSEKEFNPRQVLTAVMKLKKQVKAKTVEQQNLTGQEVFFLGFSGKEKVKIDFAYFPFSHLGEFKKYKQLKIASLEDVSVNKIQAINTRRRSRDYVDLYFCLKRLGWQPVEIIKNFRLKFDVQLNYEQLISSYVKVLDAEDLPIFLQEVDWQAIKTYFLKEAEKLKSKILTK